MSGSMNFYLGWYVKLYTKSEEKQDPIRFCPNSFCSKSYDFKDSFNFCPNCGEEIEDGFKQRVERFTYKDWLYDDVEEWHEDYEDTFWYVDLGSKDYEILMPNHNGCGCHFESDDYAVIEDDYKKAQHKIFIKRYSGIISKLQEHFKLEILFGNVTYYS